MRDQRLAHLRNDMEENERGIAALRHFLTEADQRIVSAIQCDHAQHGPEGSRRRWC
jgi:hypothetical protein